MVITAGILEKGALIAKITSKETAVYGDYNKKILKFKISKSEATVKKICFVLEK